MSNPEVKKPAATPDKTGVDFKKRFKDTQSAYTKSQQALKAAQAKLEALEKLTTPKVEIDETTRTELDQLKFDDPDKWHQRMNEIENLAIQKHSQILNEASQEAMRAAELERRAQVLEEFNRSRGLDITDEVIQFDVPPRITKKLENGEISFEAYLEEVSDYLTSPKTVKGGDSTLNQPDLNKVGGSDAPEDKATPAFDYAKVVF